MSFGRLYGFVGNARTTVLLVVAKENNLDIELVETNPDFDIPERYLKLNPLRKIPTFEAPDGWFLTEVISIAVYFTSQDNKTALLGHNPREYSQILRWMSFINMEVQPSLADWFKPLVGRRAYREEKVDNARATTNLALAVVETHLQGKIFLVSDMVTLADLFAASSLSRGFQYVFDRQWQQVHPEITRWFISVVNTAMWRRVIAEPTLVEKAVKFGQQQNGHMEYFLRQWFFPSLAAPILKNRVNELDTYLMTLQSFVVGGHISSSVTYPLQSGASEHYW